MNPLQPLDVEIIWAIVAELSPAEEQKDIFEEVVARPRDTKFSFGGRGGLGGEFRRTADARAPAGETWCVTTTQAAASAEQAERVHRVNERLAEHLARCRAEGRL